jgi:regulator of protease activity HflC (stomatin/prohibitin superfamily)
MESPALMISAAVVAMVVAGVLVVVRVVPAAHVGVVIRAGRVVRTRPSGPVVVAPGVERIEMVALQPGPIDPLAVTAMTRDGVDVRLVVSALWSVTDPTRAVHAMPDAPSLTAAAVERALRHLVADVDLTDLLRDREALLSLLPITTQPLVGPYGVELIDIDLLGLEVRVGPELLRMLV